ncbi:CoA pyrophosphatase [Sphingobium boeckii]|uniref:8-oxo-dGTP pyrophosphatase MutT (NUDIX family) n=1 Tax=Sphingobium boeckii TaxID=1082345 RepID=A0A7W9AIG0_9SPHN|nr:CoA pyrophosphatase [Sphingobium boeckii]MBB5686049.1 8-oxo-dGTP pyrophosphatase MutT (NUDIX family) [Sphingobium boeckii]
MTLVERLHHALEHGHRHSPILLIGDNVVVDDGETSLVTPAAVLIPVTDRADPGVILTQRPANMRQHPGQIAFPGGRIDPEDDGPIGAALREAEEEIALPRAAVTIIGITDPYRTITGYEVTPVIGVVPPDLVYTPNAQEVEDVFEVPLSFLLEPANHLEQAVEWQGRERHYYEITFEGRRIWGATAAMIVNLTRRLQWAD